MLSFCLYSCQSIAGLDWEVLLTSAFPSILDVESDSDFVTFVPDWTGFVEGRSR